MINVSVLTGRLVRDPEMKQTQSGVPVVSFCVAVERRGKSGEDRQTDFINIIAWRSTAEFVAKYFHKGDMIGVQGSIQTRKYQDRDGNNRTAFEIVADGVHFVGGKSAAHAAPAAAEASEGQGLVAKTEFADIPGDNLPF